MIVVVAPGQGSQTPGFLAPWLEDAAVRERVGSWSEAIGIDLAAHGTTSDADTIRDTALAQPLIVAAGLIAADALLADGRRALVGGVASSPGAVRRTSSARRRRPRTRTGTSDPGVTRGDAPLASAGGAFLCSSAFGGVSASSV